MAGSGSDKQDIRYDTTIYDTPFSALPDPKRVWIGEPSSALEGLGSCPSIPLIYYFKP